MKTKDNLHIRRMKDQLERAIRGSYHEPCAPEIISLLNEFYQKAIEVEIDWENSGHECWQVEKTIEAVAYLAENTRNYEKLGAEDIGIFKKILADLYAILNEAVELKVYPERAETVREKIACISEILCKNMVGRRPYAEINAKMYGLRDGMIFQNYEYLWQIIHKVNCEWDELTSRGFGLHVFYAYKNSVEYHRNNGQEQSEDKKYETFMAILDGSLKLVPIYVTRHAGYEPVKLDFEDKKILVENEPVRTLQVKSSKETTNS